MKQSLKEVRIVAWRINLRITFIFNTGLSSELVPWIDNAEKFTSDTLEKPKSIVEAQEIEKKCVLFAKVCLSC